MHNKHTALLWVFLFLGIATLHGQTHFVKVIPITKYDFRIANYGSLPIWVTLSDERPFKLNPGENRYYSTKDINSYSTLQLEYRKRDYRNTKAALQARGVRLREEEILADKTYKAVMKANAKSRPSYVLRENFWGTSYTVEEDHSSKFWVGLFSSGIYGTAKHNIQQQQVANEQKALLNTALYRASAGLENNIYSKDFESKYLKGLVKSNILLTPKGKLDFSFMPKRKDLNDFWSRDSEDWTWGISFSRRIGGEMRLGKSKNFVTLNGFAAWHKESFGLAGGAINQYYVDSSYVKFSDAPLYSLRTTQHINLNINRFSLGAMLEFYFYPALFFNVRAGYHLLQNSNIEFEKENTEGQLIAHLNAPYEFENRKNKEALQIEGSRLYAEARLGLLLGKSSLRQPRRGYYVAIGYRVNPRNTYRLGDNNSLYYLDEGAIDAVPVNDKETSKYRGELTLGIGLAF